HQEFSGIPDSEWFADLASQIALPSASFNRLVVHKEFRAQGVAFNLDMLRIQAAKDAKMRSVVGIAVGRSRLRALTTLGFKSLLTLPEGHGLMVPETLHTAIYLNLSQ